MNPTFYTHRTGSGCLRITGEDRADFIQRQSTNDIDKLSPGTVLTTVLTNSSARILDVLRLFKLEDDAYGALTLPGRGPSTAAFLKGRIFFNDRVSLADQSGETAVLEVLGSGASAGLEKLDVETVLPGRTAEAAIGGVTCRLAGIDDPLGRGFLLIAPVDALETLSAALKEAGAETLTDADYEKLRITQGIPGAAGELTDDFTPLEAGLDEFISDTKGCYTGQEVIARQITYDKITRRMTGIRLGAAADPGARIRAEGTRVGTLTSVVESQDEGWIGLAVIKRPYDEAGTPLRVENGEEPVEAVSAELPFSRPA